MRELYKRLSDDGFDPWLDEESLLPGKKWEAELRRAVRHSDIVVVCLSQRSITKSGYIQKEIRFALDVADEQPDDTIFLIPAKLEECEVPDRLASWQWVNLFEERGYKLLLKALRSRDAVRKSVHEELRETVAHEARKSELPARLVNPIEYNAEYILIPGGKYKYSVTRKQTEVPPLYVSKYPVTNKQYRRFVQYLRGREPEIFPADTFAESLIAKSKTIEGMPDYIGTNTGEWHEKLNSKYEDDKRFNGDDQPVVGVTWYAAVSYCHWLTEVTERTTSAGRTLFRLPNEEEWEWVAGGGKRTYPWGDEEPDDKRANFGEKLGQTTPVGAYPTGVTPEGLMDMAGNVWKWMENRYRPDQEWRALRGGSWLYTSKNLRCISRGDGNPFNRNSVIGFRVVRLAAE